MFQEPSSPVDDGKDVNDPVLCPAPDMARFGQAEQPGEYSFSQFYDDWRAELPPESHFEDALEVTEGSYIQDNDQSALEQTGYIEQQGDTFESQSTGFEQQDTGVDPQDTLMALQNASNEQQSAIVNSQSTMVDPQNASIEQRNAIEQQGSIVEPQSISQME